MRAFSGEGQAQAAPTLKLRHAHLEFQSVNHRGVVFHDTLPTQLLTPQSSSPASQGIDQNPFIPRLKNGLPDRLPDGSLPVFLVASSIRSSPVANGSWAFILRMLIWAFRRPCSHRRSWVGGRGQEQRLRQWTVIRVALLSCADPSSYKDLSPKENG